MGGPGPNAHNALVPADSGWGGNTGLHARNASNHQQTGETKMWTKPEYTEMRFGFEVTMYIANR
jgi:coenzyme PQQ precursor peptide PqqA